MTAGFKSAIETAMSESAFVTDNDLRGRAFEVILAHVLDQQVILSPPQAPALKVARPAKQAVEAPANTLSGRIQSLKSEEFFKAQRSLADVREELRTKGWHYPVTSLSGPLQQLVRQRTLRREQVTVGGKKVWKYSNF